MTEEIVRKAKQGASRLRSHLQEGRGESGHILEYDPVKQTSRARSLYLPSRGVRLEEAKAGRLGAKLGPKILPLESMYLDSAIDPATHIVREYQPSVPAKSDMSAQSRLQLRNEI